jgi:hypothetical protein
MPCSGPRKSFERGNEQMATAVLAKEIEAIPQQEPKRMQYVQSCVNKYFDWRDAGLCPAAIKDDYDALIEWDRTQNGGSLLDYDKEANFRAGLRLQAQRILLSYTRKTVTAAWGTVNVPGVARVPAGSRVEPRFTTQRVSHMTTSEVDMVIDSMKAAVKAKALRARQLGAHRRSIQAALLAAEEEANRAFESTN